jgi:archaemetzincin
MHEGHQGNLLKAARKTGGNMRCGVVALGQITDIVPKVIAAHISAFLPMDACLLKPGDCPGYAYEPKRMQYNVARIIQAVEKTLDRTPEKIVCVTDVDLFIPIMTHVFGEARQGGRVAVISTFRLGQGMDNPVSPEPLILERTAKVALHEVGHLLSLKHCTDSRCLMHFSGDIENLDGLPIAFCRYCRTFIRDACE